VDQLKTAGDHDGPPGTGRHGDVVDLKGDDVAWAVGSQIRPATDPNHDVETVEDETDRNDERQRPVRVHQPAQRRSRQQLQRLGFGKHLEARRVYRHNPIVGARLEAPQSPRSLRAGNHGATVGSVPSTEAPVTKAQITVFLLDDHEIVRRGVKELLEAEPDIVVIGEGSSAAEALARVPALRPQVAVLDVRLPDGDGVSVCRDLRSKLPDLACLMLTSFADDDALYDAILAGAAGYVLKQIKGSDLVNAVRTIASGGSLLDAKTTARIMQRLRDDAADREKADPFAALTSQEHKILDLIGEGLTNRQIGERMFLAEKTVKNYVSSLLAKLGLERRTQAAILATESKQDKHPAP
jgi:two-component system response regulator DevR